MKTYPETKTTGLDWLPEIPAHWEVKKLKYDVQEIATTTDSKAPDEIYIALENVESRTGKFIEPREAIEFESNVKRFCANDVLFGRLRPYLAKVLLAPCNGVCVGEFLVLRSKRIDPRFLQLRLLAPDAIALINSSTYGARMPRASWDFIGNTKFAIPPFPEQRAIVSYLEAKGREIESYIAAKTALLERLREWQAARIAALVTKGLDPNAPMKYSGLDWLGDIPAHWEVKKLGHLTELINGCAFKPGDWRSEGTPIIRIQNLNGGTDYNYAAPGLMPEKYIVRKGDLLFSWSGNVGTSFGPFIWEHDFEGYLNQHIFKLHNYSLPTKFFYYLLKAATSRIEDQSHGIIGLVHITKPDFNRIKVSIPPLSEQAAIVSQIESDVAIVNAARERATQEIGLARELWASLVAEVVTGKRDVSSD